MTGGAHCAVEFVWNLVVFFFGRGFVDRAEYRVGSSIEKNERDFLDTLLRREVCEMLLNRAP